MRKLSPMQARTAQLRRDRTRETFYAWASFALVAGCYLGVGALVACLFTLPR